MNPSLPFSIGVATATDLPALRAMMDRAIAQLQSAWLDPAQIAASRAIMGLDTQLIEDGTYFVVHSGGVLAGSGGWSWRATLYGGDHSAGLRDAGRLDPARDPARIRAMYTDPAFARRGVGRMVLGACEAAAALAGFTRVELMATLSGAALYRACGYSEAEDLIDARGGAPVPLLHMTKTLRRV